MKQVCVPWGEIDQEVDVAAFAVEMIGEGGTEDAQTFDAVTRLIAIEGVGGV